MAGRKKSDKTPRKRYEMKIRVTEEIRNFADEVFLDEGKSFNAFINAMIEQTKEFRNFQITKKLEKLKNQNSCSQNEAKKD